MSSENTKLGFKMEGFVTNANYSVKKLQFLLFINRTLPRLLPRLKLEVEEGLGIRIALQAYYLGFVSSNRYMSSKFLPP